MKSIAKLVENHHNDITFPQMYKNIEHGFIVLFINKRTGVVISQGNKPVWPMCHWSDLWTPCNTVEIWERLPVGSQVTLIQEDTID